MQAFIGTAKLNDVESEAWLDDVRARVAEMPQVRLGGVGTAKGDGRRGPRSGSQT